MVPKTMDSEDVELLKLIADGTTHFRPVQDEPSDSPRWGRASGAAASVNTG